MAKEPMVIDQVGVNFGTDDAKNLSGKCHDTPRVRKYIKILAHG